MLKYIFLKNYFNIFLNQKIYIKNNKTAVQHMPKKRKERPGF